MLKFRRNKQMATKKEIKEILKELNLTKVQMDEFWTGCYDTNFIVKNLTDNGKTWRDMNGSVIRKLPTQKERDLESIEKKRVEDEEKTKKELEEKQSEDYYYEHFEELMVEKIDKNEKLTERELSEIREYSIEDDEGDEGRWVRHMTSIVEMCGRFFELNWSRGLTEYQENEFYDQPFEVVKSTYEKTITVTEWVAKTV